MINDHKNEIHPEFFVIIILHTGKVRIVRRGRSEEFHIYVNFFMENWDGKNDTSEFFINKPKYDKCLYSMLLEE